MENNLYQEFRYEKKSIISEMGKKEVEHHIKRNPSMFKEIYQERKINNIYLDSVGMKNYLEHTTGHSKRIKIRIRWYGNTFGKIKNPILEIKSKNNELGKKTHFKLKSFSLNKGFSFKDLQEVFINSSLPKAMIHKLKFYKPCLLNSYNRKYFRSVDGKVRLTLDWRLQFYKLRNFQNFFYEKYSLKNMLILEIKYMFENSEEANSVAQHLPFRFVAHSKYISGTNLLKIL